MNIAFLLLISTVCGGNTNLYLHIKRILNEKHVKFPFHCLKKTFSTFLNLLCIFKRHNRRSIFLSATAFTHGCRPSRKISKLLCFEINRIYFCIFGSLCSIIDAILLILTGSTFSKKMQLWYFFFRNIQCCPRHHVGRVARWAHLRSQR